MNYLDKKKLRKEYKKIRLELLDKDKKSKLIMNKLLNMNEIKNSKNIAIYYSMDFEVDTKNIICKLLDDGRNIYLPKTFENGKMDFYKIDSLNYMDDNKFFSKINLKEPNANCEIINGLDIDVMIIPGICFDRNKNRIGFGKGFYDKYLENKNNFIKIGICFNSQILKNGFIRSNQYDIPMDIIITELEDIF